MGRFPAGKFNLWIGQPVHAPHVNPPFSLRAFSFLCILVIAGLLVFTVFEQLQPGTSSAAPGLMIATAVVYFVLPIAIILAVWTNRGASRPLIVLFLAAVTMHAVIATAGVPEISSYIRMLAAAEILIVAGWLFISLKLRVYFAIVNDKPLPTDLPRPVEEILAPGNLERWFQRTSDTVAPFLELLVTFLILSAVIVAYLRT